MIEVNDVLTLNDKINYVVISKVLRNEKEYFHICAENNFSNFKFCYINGDKLTEIRDKNSIVRLLPLFLKSINNE